MANYLNGNRHVGRLKRDEIEMNSILEIADKLSKDRHVRLETFHSQGGPFLR